MSATVIAASGHGLLAPLDSGKILQQPADASQRGQTMMTRATTTGHMAVIAPRSRTNTVAM